MTTATAIAQLDALDQTINFVTGIFEPILAANNDVCPAALLDDAYITSLQDLRNNAGEAKVLLFASLDFATKNAISQIRAEREGR